MNNRKKGTEFEDMAAKYITEHGYNILEKNYNGRFGEIDIIAHKASVLIFFEVKYRSSMNFGDPSEAVDVRKQRKICHTALEYCAYHGYKENTPCRFDVIAIYPDNSIRHIKNAFDYVQ